MNPFGGVEEAVDGVVHAGLGDRGHLVGVALELEAPAVIEELLPLGIGEVVGGAHAVLNHRQSVR